MTFTGFPAEAFDFYEGLQADNSKTYWTAHKQVYDEAVRGPLLALAGDLEKEFGAAKVFRPNRDVRFSADKSPYKTHQGLYCSPQEGVGFYLQLDADGLMTAGGFHLPSRDMIARYRSAVDNQATGTALEKILAKLEKAGFERGGDTVRTRPRGCPPDHPRLELMRHESLTAHRRHDPGDDRLGTAAVVDLVRKDWRALRPLNEWVQENMG
jgi:uncharacterized protein (TIGR02453 family)